MKAIAEKVRVSERTVRRYVRGVKPEIRVPSELDSDELTDGFFDQVLAARRRIVKVGSEHWDEPFELGFEAVDSAMKSLRERLAVPVVELVPSDAPDHGSASPSKNDRSRSDKRSEAVVSHSQTTSVRQPMISSASRCRRSR